MQKVSIQAGAFMAWAIFALISSGCRSQGKNGDSYPSRPITYLVPWAAGGMTDMTSRMMGAVLQKQLGQPVNVVNRTGGGGVVGHLALSQAAPDGYTLGAVTVEITQLHHMGLTDLTFSNYTPLALLIHNPAAITVRADEPWSNLDELIQEIKNNPGKLQASGTARGGIWDLARIGFLQAAGLSNHDVPWVPSQGAAPALQELIAGGVDIVTASISEVDALRKAGQVKTLAVMADERLPGFEMIPTLKEHAINWSIGGWVSICAPANLSPDIKSKLDSAIYAASIDPLYVESLTKAGSTLRYMNSTDLELFMMVEDNMNGELMDNAGLHNSTMPQ